MATAPKISNLPAAPNRQQPASFTPKSDALLSALPGFVGETNAVADYVEAAAGQVAIDKAAVDANVPLLNDAKAAAPLALQYRDITKGYKDSAAASEAQTLQHLQDVQSAIVYQDLASIAATKGITMTAGFIDTSPNPPISVQMAGSLWREPLNTATRGSRRELPTKKVWIIEARKIALYDGDDPALPLWRDFTAGRPAYSVTKFDMVRAENGVMITSGVAGYKGYLKIDFNSDLWEYHGDGAGGNGKGTWSGPINNPALQLSGSAGVSDTGVYGTVFRAGYNLVSNYILCMDSRVYDWAPKHPISGLPVPTFALGTEEGITILNGPAGAGTYVDIVHSSSTDVTSISLNADGSLFYVTDNGVAGRYVHGRTSLPLVDELRGAGGNVSGSEFFFHSIESVDYAGQSGKLLGGSANFIADGVVGGASGLTFLRPNQANPDETLRAFVDTDFNTGWMAKGCEGVWFCDTDTSAISEQELGGELSLADFSYDNSIVQVEDLGDRFRVTKLVSDVNAPITFDSELVDAGFLYSASFEVLAMGASNNFYIQLSHGGGTSFGVGGYASVPRVFSGTTKATGAGSGGVRFSFHVSRGAAPNSAQAGDWVEIPKTFNVTKADGDRSGMGNYATVGGILTRTPMGNSDAVGYAGAGSAEIPTELTQVGTGDFCFTGVVELNANANQLLFGQSQQNPDIPSGGWSYAAGLSVTLNYTGSNKHALNVYLSQVDGQGDRVSYRKTGVDALYVSGQVLAISVVRRGDFVQIMVNGEIMKVDSGFGAIDVQPTLPAFIREKFGANSAQPMRDIKFHKGHAPSNDELREIARADLAKQNGPTTMRGVVKKAYNVTKDRVTGLVHVGNNGGRSTFAYPLLVDESSDTALNAIAAHDGMILEN